MTLLVRASELIGRPVVTLRGDDPAEIKDVVLGLDQACLVGFTLRGRGFLDGQIDRSLAWRDVHAVGRDAVVVEGDLRLRPHEDLERAPAEGDEVTDIEVVTDDGQGLGRVRDVVVTTGRPARVVGFEIEASAALAREGQRMLLPVDEMVSVSDRALVVPADTATFVRDDLTGFGAGVEEYRNREGGGRHAAH